MGGAGVHGHRLRPRGPYSATCHLVLAHQSPYQASRHLLVSWVPESMTSSLRTSCRQLVASRVALTSTRRCPTPLAVASLAAARVSPATGAPWRRSMVARGLMLEHWVRRALVPGWHRRRPLDLGHRQQPRMEVTLPRLLVHRGWRVSTSTAPQAVTTRTRNGSSIRDRLPPKVLAFPPPLVPHSP